MQQMGGKYDLMVDSSQIIVNVSNPAEVKGTITSYTVYSLHGTDGSGEFETKRRYSDFDRVREVMVKNWPGCYVPPLPRKKVIGNSESMFVESRRQGLSEFCVEISLLKNLWYSREFQILVRGKENIEKALKQVQEESFQQILEKYQQKFSDLVKRECQQRLSLRVEGFGQALKRISSLISGYKQTAKSVSEAFGSNADQYQVLLKYVFPEYEKHFLSSYIGGSVEGRLVFANSNDQKLQDMIGEMKKIGDGNQVDGLYLLLEKEERQIEGFLQILKIRAGYENTLRQYQSKDKDLLLQQSRLNTGKQSLFKSLIKSDIEQDKKAVQTAIESNRQKMTGMKKLYELMTIILAEYEIPRFEDIKLRKYYETIHEMGEFQLRLCSIKEEICDYVLGNVNIPTGESLS